MRKFTALMLAAILTLTLASCMPGSMNKQQTPAATQTTAAAPKAQAATQADAKTATQAATQAAQTATQAAAPKAASEPGPYGKFNPPITISTIRSIDTTREYMPGETWDNNIWTKAYEEKLGIKFTYTWTCMSNEFSERLNTAIASDDLPDYMNIPYDQFALLARSGRLEPITAAFNEYALPELKTAMEKFDGLATTQASFDGQLYGIVSAPSMEPHMLWYRNDWAEAVGKGKPATFEDVLNMAVDFATKNPNGDGTPTVGFGVDKDLFDGGMGLDGFFSAYGTYPRQWVEVNGQLQYGFLQADKLKAPLQKLQELYKNGVIDQDFLNKGTWDTAPDDIVKGKIGMVMGPIWFGDWKCAALLEAVGNNKATWTVMPIPSLSGGPVNRPPVGIKPSAAVCVSTGFKYPEAAVKIVNLSRGLLNGDIAEGKYHDQPNPNDPTKVVNNFFHSLAMDVGNGDVSWNYVCALAVTDALKTGDTSKLNAEQKSYYDRCKGWVDGTSLAGYTSYSIFGPGGSQFVGEEIRQKGLFYADPYYGASTEAMNNNIGNINSKRDEIITKIIMGGDIDAGLKDFADYWSASEGDVITKDVNDWYAGMKK